MAVYDTELVSVEVTRIVPTRVTAPPRIMVEVILCLSVIHRSRPSWISQVP
jgi:hypothetical protein